MLMINCN